MEKYSYYNESHVNWIGAIPREWKLVPLKHISSIEKGRKAKEEFQDFKEGLIPYLAMDYLRNQTVTPVYVDPNDPTIVLVDESDLLVLWDGSKAGEIVKAKIGALSSTMGKIHLNSTDFDLSYLTYYLKVAERYLQANTVGMGIPHVDGKELRGLYIVKPSLEEQIQIVRYLNHQTVIIDDLIKQKEKLIELLKEKRQAVINQAVTKGLNPDAKMKNSGVEWLGEVPADWALKRLGFISDLFTGFPWKSELFDFEDGIKVVRGENVSEGFLRWGERTRFWRQEVENDSKYFLKEDDIVIAMDGSKVGKNYVLIDSSDLPLLLHQRMCRVRVNENICPKFISYYIGSDMFRYYIDISKTDPMIPHITQKNIFNFQIAIPTKQIQMEIVAFLDNKIQTIDRVFFNERKHIEKLKDYRQSIISEAVTGKIDVREWTINKQELV